MIYGICIIPQLVVLLGYIVNLPFTLSESHALVPRFLNQRGWRTSDIDSQIHTMEEENPEEDLYATYAMLHTYSKE